jgi:rare lipoprotein A (peptidoglycan hydrolase)
MTKIEALRRVLFPRGWMWLTMALLLLAPMVEASSRHHRHPQRKHRHRTTAPAVITPELICHHRQVGLASWYGPGADCKGCPRGGNWTANGERFTGQDLTAAHRTLPMGTLVQVCQGDGSKCIVVRINDRGPAAKTGRIIDLSHRAATDLGIMGVEPVELCWE